MESSAKKLTCAQVNELDLVSYLSRQGHEPKKVTGNDYWYLSPLHGEHTASFKVNRKINRWYDFGIGRGGNLIDFGILYFKCTVGEFLKSFDHSLPAAPQTKSVDKWPDNKIIITETRPLSAPSLLRYLTARGIDPELAQNYCNQVHYKFNNKPYFGVGFQNDSGGYEISNAFYKSSSSPKDVTTIKNGSKDLSVFEGFIDFLSFLILYHKPDDKPTDYLILNSLSFFEKQGPFMESYSHTYLYLDNDSAGQNCSAFACKKSSVYVRKDHLYDGYNDLNDRLTCKPIPTPTPTHNIGKRIT